MSLEGRDLSDPEVEELCAAYWAYFRARHAGDDDAAEPLWWAWERVDAIGAGRPGTESIDVVRVLVALAESSGGEPWALPLLGAGPVEDYLNSERCDRSQIEAAAETSADLRRSIGYAR